MVGQVPLEDLILVRVQAPQQSKIYEKDNYNWV